MSTMLTTTDILPPSVPKLMPTGVNWMAFSICFEEAIEAKGFWGHFYGTTPHPVLVASPATQEAEAIAKWDHDEKSAKALLTHCIPNSTLICIHGKSLLKEHWDLIVTEYTMKGAFAQADLCACFMELHCPKKGNV